MSIYRSPEKLSAFIISWIEEKIKAAGAKGAVLGVSGGIDSAVLAGLLSRACGPDKVMGVIMPCHSTPLDEEYGRMVAGAFKIKICKVDLSHSYDVIKDAIEQSGVHLSEMTSANIKPRLRMTTLYSIAQQLDCLVCGGSNKDELIYGYFTKHGDSGVDLLPMTGLLKGEVRAVAQYLGVPPPIIERPPTAGLWEGQTDENEMGMTYDEIDSYLATGIASEAVVKKIEGARARTEHKRNFPPAPIIPD